jgi:hypothetical protein
MHGRLGRRRFLPGVRAILAILIVAASAGLQPLRAQTGATAEEYQLKAAFVYRFPQFVEWPPDVFDGQDSLHICVSAPNPFGMTLEELVAGETMNGRRLVVRDVGRSGDVGGCHVLFVPAAGSSERLLQAAKGPVLTIGESPTFLDEGGIINLRVIDRRVRFEVNAAAAERSGLKLSSQLLRLAMVVRGAQP